MEAKKTKQKNLIYFSRTYRHFKPNSKKRWLFLLLWVLPCFVLFMLSYTKISYIISLWVKQALSNSGLEGVIGISYSEFLPVLGGVFYVHLPSTMPSLHEVELNIFITLVLISILFFFLRGKKGGTPFTIYFLMILFTHLISSIYFMFAMEYFPYSASQYSELYMLQQTGIWISFIVLSGLIAGVVGYANTIVNITFFLTTMMYSFVFGCVRYLTFLFIITSGSSLYMTTLFFTLGPLYDFLYFVFIYSIYVNIQIKSYDTGTRRSDWQWM